MRKNFLFLIFILLIAGCSNHYNDFNEYLASEEYLNKDIFLEGEIKFFQNGNYYLVDKNNVKIKLIDCYDKYDVILGEKVKITGFLIKNNNEFSFVCDSHDNYQKQTESEIAKLTHDLELKQAELLEITSGKDDIINKLDLQIEDLNRQIKEKEDKIIFLTHKIDNATIQKDINDIKQDILERAKYLPETPNVEEFQIQVMLGAEIYHTSKVCTHSNQYVCNKGLNWKYTDKYSKLSRLNKDYKVEVYAYRFNTNDFYSSYEIIIERVGEKWTCTRE